jgi:hypothetical protein
MGVAPEAIVEQNFFFEYRLKYSVLHYHASTQNSLAISFIGCAFSAPNGSSPQGYSRMFVGYSLLTWLLYCRRQPCLLFSVIFLFDSHHIWYSSIIWICWIDLWSFVLFVTSVAKFSYTSSLLSAYRFMGSAVIFIFLCPLVGCRFRSFRHVSAHVPSPRRYIKG